MATRHFQVEYEYPRTRRAYLRRVDHDLNAIMGLAPGNPHGKRLRQRFGKVRNSLFTFLDPAESGRLRPTR